ncbi:MAG: hypothetical protein C4K60_15665 [Ideonella sp. MAG2]|nr:MAG: hypothetical protein C4K60_15665 [Ideonella sp. MAG2]
MPTPTTPPGPEAGPLTAADAEHPDTAEGAAAAAPTFWRSLPGILTGIATVITAATSLFVALRTPSPVLVTGTTASSPAQAASTAAPPATAPTPAPTPAPAPAPVPAPHPVPPRVLVPHFEAASQVLATPLASGRRVFIHDPDGFSNLRAAPGTRSAIITRLPQGQGLERLREEDGWWLVRTPEGQTGWVHGSRLKGVP